MNDDILLIGGGLLLLLMIGNQSSNGPQAIPSGPSDDAGTIGTIVYAKRPTEVTKTPGSNFFTIEKGQEIGLLTGETAIGPDGREYWLLEHSQIGTLYVIAV